MCVFAAAAEEETNELGVAGIGGDSCYRAKGGGGVTKDRRSRIEEQVIYN